MSPDRLDIAGSQTERARLLARLDAIGRLGLAAGGTIALLTVLWSLNLEWSGRRQFATPLSMLLHYVLPGGVAVTLLGALGLRPLYRARVLISCIAIGLSAYAIECVLLASSTIDTAEPVMARLAKSRDKTRYAAALRTSGHDIDTRTADEVLADVRQTDAGAIPIVSPSNHLFLRQADGRITSAITIDGAELMPLASVSNRTTILCNENGQWIQYRADSHGFNNPDDTWRLDRLDVGLIGDSFAHGYCVPSERSFGGLIRQRYPKTLNLGVAGDGPLLMLATLSEYLAPRQPTVVLWFYFEGNDLQDLQQERGSALLRNYLRDDFSQSALRQQSDIDRAILAEIPRLEATAQNNLRRSRSWRAAIYPVVDFATLTALRRTTGLIAPAEPDELRAAADFDGPNMQVFREILQKAKARVETWNGQLYFVYLPNWEGYTARYRSRGNMKRADVLTMVGDLGISLIDLDPIFRSSGDPLSLFPFRASGHYTETGHGLVAEEVLRRLPTLSPLGELKR